MKIVSSIAAASIAIGAVVTTAEAEHVQRSLIIGGSTVPVGAKSYTAGLRSTAGGASFCAGALITKKHVLTSMNCARDAKYVAVGTNSINGAEGEQIKVKSVVNHPNATALTDAYDFAVLTLERPSNFTSVTLPVANSTIGDGTRTIAMGWGETSSLNGHTSAKLRSVELMVRNNTKCHKQFDWVGKADFCAGGVKGKDLCSGDNGGPLIIEGKKGDLDDVLVGVSSWVGCNAPGMYAIFSRVSAAVVWINTVTTK